MGVGGGVFSLELLYRIPQVDLDGGFAISPDGRRIAFAWNRTGIWQIFIVGIDGGAIQQISRGSGGKCSPHWSPDGSALVYCIDHDGSENYDLYRYDFNTGLHTNLTPNTPQALQPALSWSPDGRWLAMLSDQDGGFAPYLLPAQGGSPRLLRHLPYPACDVDWSPDGAWLAVTCEAIGQEHYTYLLPVTGTPPIAGDPLLVGTGAAPICARESRWSPDSRRLAFASDASGRFELGVFDLDSQQIEWVTAGEGDKTHPCWAQNGRQLTYLRSIGPRSWVEVLDLADLQGVAYQVGSGVHAMPHYTPDHRFLILVFTNPAHPADLWRLDLQSGHFVQLTQSLPVDFRHAAFIFPTEISYPSLDGVPVPALYYSPVGVQNPPAVIYIHGGPNWLTQVTWDPLLQHMLSRGWAVLAPNYRGSTGYGREWQLASRFDYGRVDTWDVVAGADYLVREGLADSRRIVVTGRSWGGYLTMTCLAQYPERWAGGSAVVPFLNWFTGHANSRADLRHWDLQNFGDPERDHALYYERSPFFFLEQVQAPVQLICGAHDPRCPASESIQAHHCLRAAGKVCDLVLYPDEGHSFLKLENVLDADKRRVAFLAKALAAGRLTEA